jgi:hypothetical protein
VVHGACQCWDDITWTSQLGSEITRARARDPVVLHTPDDAQIARSPIVHAAQARYWSITVCTFVRLGCTSSMRAGMWRSKKKQPPRRDRLTWHMRTSLLSSIYCIYCMHVCAECGILPWYSMHIEWADAHPSCTQAILAVSETPTSYRQ